MSYAERLSAIGAEADAAIAALTKQVEGTKTPTPTTTKRFPGDPGTTKMLYGASSDPGPLEGGLGKPLQPWRVYGAPNMSVDGNVKKARDAISAGRLPWLSTKFPGPSTGDVNAWGKGSWPEVISGKHDAWIRDLANGLKALGKPVWFSPHHEPYHEGSDGPTFVKFYVHVIDVMRSVGATNIAYTPIMNGYPYLPTSQRAEARTYNPPASHMDFFSYDHYNGWYVGGKKEWAEWGPKAQIITDNITQGVPVAVGEYGCREDPANPSRAAQWLRAQYDWCLEHKYVGVSYFNSSLNSPDGPWTLDGARKTEWLSLAKRATTARL